MLVTWVNGKEADRLPITDRGFQYGDGVWETLAIREGKVMQLTKHLQRLQKGLDALGITNISITTIEKEVLALVALAPTYLPAQTPRGVLKIIISRGSGGRGFYYGDNTLQPTRIISLYTMPVYPATYSQRGIRLTQCQTRLAHHPQLAGFKRLGCVEQVLARAEFQMDYQEGLMRNHNEHIIEGTMSNLFVITAQGTIITPDLQMCGVAGIARSCIVKQVKTMGVDLQITNITETDLQQAKGLFMSNSIIRLWPVREYCSAKNNKTYSIPPLFRALEKTLNLIL